MAERLDNTGFILENNHAKRFRESVRGNKTKQSSVIPVYLRNNIVR